MYLPAAQLISLADLLCVHAASSHIVLLLSDDIKKLIGYCDARVVAVKYWSCTPALSGCGWLVIGAIRQKFSQFFFLTDKKERIKETIKGAENARLGANNSPSNSCCYLPEVILKLKLTTVDRLKV